MRLAAGAAVGTAAYQAGKRHESQGQVDDQVPDPDRATSAPQPAPVAAPAATADDTTSELERLASLHTSGVLTDDEFSAAKAKLLGI